VKAQQEAADSHLKIFKKLTTIRKKEIFKKGDYTSALSNSKRVYSYKRQYEKELAIVVLNFGLSQEVVDLTALYQEIPSQFEVYVTSLNSGITSG
jgi:glycosidase